MRYLPEEDQGPPSFMTPPPDETEIPDIDDGTKDALDRLYREDPDSIYSMLRQED